MTRPFLAYGRQNIDEADIAAVAKVLSGDWLTTGPEVEAFEATLAAAVGAAHAVVCNSGTAALYLAFRGAALEPGDAVVVPTVTFVASASAAVLAGLEVIFADVDPDTGLMELEHIRDAIGRANGHRVRAICPVHLGGRLAHPSRLAEFAADRGLIVVEDACHALGTTYGNGAHQIGDCRYSVASCFSFHPVKTVTMGEGGAITTNSEALANRMRRLRSHGLNRNFDQMQNTELAFGSGGSPNPWYYEVSEIGHNFRASDINCALGRSQLRKLPEFVETRRKLMARYAQKLSALAPAVKLISAGPDCNPGWHLCAVLMDFARLGQDRATLMQRLKERGVGTQVHYIPVHLQPFYRDRYGAVDLPGANAYYERTLSLPLFPSMTVEDVDYVVSVLGDSL